MKFLVTIQSLALIFIWQIENNPTFGFQGVASSFTLKKNRENHVTSSRLFMSVPNAFDTLTSGLASIVRVDDKGLAGVTVSNVAKTNSDIRLKLFDIENCNSCRLVRESVTELDLVIEKIIPATPTSSAVADQSSPDSLPPGQEVPCLVAAFPDGEEKVVGGAPAIIDFLKENFSYGSSSIVDAGEDTLEQVVQAVSPILLSLASALRVGRGTNTSPAVTSSMAVSRPNVPLIVYSYEGNQFCRLVREVLTELDIVYELRSAGKGSPRRNELAELTGGSTQCPYLVDPNTGTEIAESADIIRYLYKTYALWTPPSELLEWTSKNVMSLLKPVFAYLAPLQAGSGEESGSYVSDLAAAKEEIEAETKANPVVIYSYDLSPFSSETKALLNNLDIPFLDIPLGKEWIPGLLPEQGATKRAALLEMTGQSSLPHVFVDGESIGGLFNGSPGVIPLLKQSKFVEMCQNAMN